MTSLTIFAPLVRALTGGRHPAPTRRRTGRELTLGSEWCDLLEEFGLPQTTFHDVLASGSLHPHFHYRHFSRPKKDGGQREIAEPDANLKRLQRELMARYFEGEQPHPAAMAYRKNKSIANHVWPHAGAEWLVTADVADFFPATREGRIEEWWRERVDTNTARLLTILTTYRGGLPQGAPTSPGLSNLVNRELDERLAGRADAAGARYTRYCDDMVFSWPRGLGPPSDFEMGVRATLHEFGYILHLNKGWRVHQRRDEPEVTGVILTRRGRVRLPAHLRRVMRRLGRSDNPHDACRLAGYFGYQAMIQKLPKRPRR